MESSLRGGSMYACGWATACRLREEPATSLQGKPMPPAWLALRQVALPPSKPAPSAQKLLYCSL